MTPSLRALARPLFRLVRWLAYRRELAQGRPAGEAVPAWREWEGMERACVEIFVRADRVQPEAARDFCSRQTLRELRVVATDGSGAEAWRIEGPDADATPVLLYAPGSLPRNAEPTFLESAFLIAAAEGVDAVALPHGVLLGPSDASRRYDAAAPEEPAELGLDPWRRRTLFVHSSWVWEPRKDRVVPHRARRDRILVKVPGLDFGAGPRRRGPYLADHGLGARLEVPLRDASKVGRVEPAAGSTDGPTPLLVLAPFLARGGAEHTLHATLDVLRERFSITYATLAHHRPELDDRRRDFAEISPDLFPLGDLVRPEAMPGMLRSLLASRGIRHVYNANSTTLFYDFLDELRRDDAELRRDDAELRLVDHLYDHRVGYIERYAEPALLETIDACVAENRRIAAVLRDEHGWPPERVPVIWPCGRAPRELPAPQSHDALRRRLRRELEISDDAVVLLTAARMHEQKRPLDLVRLAERFAERSDEVLFLVVGGGPMQDEVSRAADAARERLAPGVLPLRRLGFRLDVPELIVASDAGCLVSDFEGLPVFLLECLQLGRPFLGTDVGDMGHVIRDTGAGWVVEEPGDLEALERAVCELLDPARRGERAERARAAGPRFAPGHCARRYAAAFLGAPVPPEAS